jgi:hypothetical protein
MAVKLSGVEFKAFWADDSWFPPNNDGCVEEEAVFVNDGDEPLTCDDHDYPSQIDDQDRVKVVGGYLNDYRDNTHSDLEAILRAWRKRQATDYIVLRVPKSVREAFDVALASLQLVFPGIKVQK